MRVHHRLGDAASSICYSASSRAIAAELAHGLLQLGLFRLLRRVTGTRWAPTGEEHGRRAA
jgi:hypothetical protein